MSRQQVALSSATAILLAMLFGAAMLPCRSSSSHAPGAVIWSMTSPEVSHYLSQGSVPAVYAGHVYASSVDFILYHLDAKTGKILGVNEDINYQSGSAYAVYPPVMSNGLVYIGGYCLNAKSGQVVWKNEDWEGPSGYAVAISSGRSFLGEDGDKKFQCLDAKSGKLLWKRDIPEPRFGASACAVSGHRVLVATEESLYCLDVKSGKILWKSKQPCGSPAVYKGLVYVWVEGNGLCCLNQSDGSFLWQFAKGVDESSPTVSQGKVVFADRDFLYCLNAQSGKLLWRRRYYASDVSISRGRVYFTGERVTCLRLDDGKKLWESKVIGPGSEPVIYKGKLFVSAGDTLYCLDAGDPQAGGWEMVGGGPEHHRCNRQEE